MSHKGFFQRQRLFGRGALTAMSAWTLGYRNDTRTLFKCSVGDFVHYGLALPFGTKVDANYYLSSSRVGIPGATLQGAIFVLSSVRNRPPGTGHYYGPRTYKTCHS